MAAIIYNRERQQKETQRIQKLKKLQKEDNIKVKEQILKEKYTKAALIEEQKYIKRSHQQELIFQRQKEADKQKQMK